MSVDPGSTSAGTKPPSGCTLIGMSSSSWVKVCPASSSEASSLLSLTPSALRGSELASAFSAAVVGRVARRPAARRAPGHRSPQLGYNV